MKKKLMLILSFFFIGIGLANAQTQASGTVVDETGEPVIGATVVVKGTTTGTITDMDGKFEVFLPVGKNTLVFNLVGMKDVEAEASNGMRVVLQADATQLKEVEIQVAYGTTKKSTFTGAAGVMQAKDIQKLQVSSISKALEGAVPGLQVASSSGQPGDEATLRIRGFGSISAGSSPLIVVDGTPFDGGMNSINPSDIQSITVLKDAASAALYGSRAANGVVMITTKRGESGKPKVTLDIRQGMNMKGVSTYDVMTSHEDYLRNYWMGMKNSGYVSTSGTLGDSGKDAAKDLIKELGGYNPYVGVADDKIIDGDGKILTAGAQRRYSDSWEDELIKIGHRQEYNVSVSNGTDKLSSFLSMGYLGDEGIFVKTGFKRYSGRANLEYKVTDNIKVGGNMAYTRGIKTATKSSEYTSSASNIFFGILNAPPIYPLYMYDQEGNRMKGKDGKDAYDWGDGEMPGTIGRKFNELQNPLGSQYLDKNEKATDIVASRAFAEVKFLKDFKFTTNMGFDVQHSKEDIFYNSTNGDAKDLGRIMKTISRMESMTFNQLLNYTKSFENVHNFSLLVGHESYSLKEAEVFAHKTGVFIDKVNEFNNATTMNDLSSGSYKKSLDSYLSQVLYDYKGLYYLSGSLRRDGSSVFHKDNRWGDFWSVGGSWRISGEEFMKSVKVVNNLRLRASYGTSGNDEILSDRGYSNYLPYMNQYTLRPTGAYVVSYKGNKNIKWEVNKNFDVGLEASMFDSRLNVELDFFRRSSTDLLYNKPLPISSGYSFQPENIGDMLNTGFEFTVGADIIKTYGLRWNMTFNGSTYKNEITKLPNKQIIKANENRILRVGGTIYDFYVSESAGVDETTGKALWYYTDPATNERATTDDLSLTLPSGDRKDSRIVGGTIIPDFTGAVTTTLEYKGFDFSAMLNFQVGGKILDDNYANLMHSGNLVNNWHKDIAKAWTPENTKTDVPKLDMKGKDANAVSTRFLIGADYLNIRSVTLGYTVNNNLLKNLQMSHLRFFVSADNLALFSKRKGLDPRQALSSSVTGRRQAHGQSDYAYTAIRTLSLGVNINF